MSACLFCHRKPAQPFRVDYRGERPPSMLALEMIAYLCLDCADALSRSNGPHPADDEHRTPEIWRVILAHRAIGHTIMFTKGEDPSCSCGAVFTEEVQ